MLDMLCYDIEGLNLSTLKSQITGNNKSQILDYISNVEDVAEAFQILDVHYGSIRTIIPKLKKQLNAMKNFPKNREEENSNVQKLLNLYKTMKSHKKENEIINFEFITEMSNKLSEENKMKCINNEIEDCAGFIKHIKSVQRNNAQFIWSQPAPPVNKTHSHMAQTMTPGAPADRGTRQAPSQVICHICDTKDQHRTYACPTCSKNCQRSQNLG